MAESTRTTVGFVKESSLCVAKANALRITSDETNRRAATMLSGLKALVKEIDEHHNPIIRTQLEALKTAKEAKARYRDPVETAIEVIKGKSITWDTEQRRIAEKERQRLQAIADKKAENERRANEEIARDLKKAGNPEAAKQVEAILVKAEKVVVSGPREIPGQKFKPAYSAEVVDLKALVIAWLAGKVDVGAIQANDVLLGQMARNPVQRNEVRGYPGVVVNERTVLATI